MNRIICELDSRDTQEYLNKTFPIRILPESYVYFPEYWTIEEDDIPEEVREYFGLTKEQFPDK